MMTSDSNERRGARPPARRNKRAQDCPKLQRLRRAVAMEFAAKLPPAMTLTEFARLTGRSSQRIRAAAERGEITTTCSPEGTRIRPADNIQFLERPQLLVLPPQGSGTSPEVASGEQPEGRREVSVSAAAFELLWEQAVEAGSSPEAILDRLISR